MNIGYSEHIDRDWNHKLIAYKKGMKNILCMRIFNILPFFSLPGIVKKVTQSKFD